MTDGRKNVPFAIPEDEHGDDVFSSVEVQRGEEPSSPNDAPRTSQSMPAVGSRSPSQPTAPAVRQQPKPRLKVETAGQPGGRSVDVTGPSFTIGRNNADLDVVDEYVSPFHANLRFKDKAVFLQDTGSHNGVFLRIADELALEDWDEIAVGTQRFMFRTTWDPRPQVDNPYEPPTPAIGGNLPPDSARLIQMYAGGQIGGVWRLRELITIGRQNADVCEPDDPWLSTPHATIERRNGKFFIKDARSQYGTFVRMLDAVELIDGDVFMVGRSRIKISYP